MNYVELSVLSEDFCSEVSLVHRLGEVVLGVEYDMVDEGIGAYEFWGMNGVHHNWQPEITEINHSDAEMQEYINQNFEQVAAYIYNNFELE